MPTRRFVAIAGVALALLGLVPGSAFAAGGTTVSGTVTRDGAPASGVDVGVLVIGNDMVWHTTTDAKGAWAVVADIAVGQHLQITAVSPTTQSPPDENGCVSYTAASGSASVTVDAVPLAPLTLALDHPINSRVCSATATPAVRRTAPVAQPTPPATDAGTPGSGGGPGMVLITVALAALALLAVGPLARRPRRRD